MICFIALIVFGILAIFSASYRPLAKEAFDCVLRRVTLRKCTTGLDKRLKAEITGKIMRKSQGIARFTYKHFELLSWIFVILFFASLGYSIYSGYNYVRYGNCYGPEESGYFCPYSAFTQSSTNIKTNYTGEIVFPSIDDDPSIGQKGSSVVIIEFGCYMCHYTREAEPIVKELLKKYEGKILYVYRDFPISERHANADWHSEAANCALEQGKFWQYHEKLFEMQEICGTAEDHIELLKEFAKEIGLNETRFNECLDSRKYREEVIKDFNDGIKAGVRGTPTFFINNRTIVGPKPIAAFEKIIDEELKK